MAVGSTNYVWQMPSQGTDPWANEFYTMVNAIDAKMLANEPPDGKTLKWGLITDGHYFEAVDNEPGTAVGYVGTHDRKDGSFKNLGFEAQGAIPPAAGNHFVGRAVLNSNKLWVCRDAAGGSEKYTPVTRPTLVVGPSAEAEYTTIAAAISDVPAAGATILVLPGSYVLVSEVVVPDKTHIIGLGRGVNVDCSGSTENIAFRITDVGEVTIAGMTITGDSATSSIKITATDDFSVHDITIEDVTFVDGAKAVEMSTAFVHTRVCIRNCFFKGVAVSSGTAIDVSSKIRDFRLEDSSFTFWGQAADKRVVQIVGGATSRQAHIRGLSFDTNGAVAGVDEDDLYIEKVDDLVVAEIASRSCGGTALIIKDSNRVVVSGVIIDSPADAGVELDAITDSSLSNVSVDNASDDGWRTLNACSKVRFVNCSSNGAMAAGFDLDGGSYLSFEGCTSRGSAANQDLNVAAAVTNSRFGMALQTSPSGTFAASNGRKKTYPINILGWNAVSGGNPTLDEIGDPGGVGEGWSAWAFDKGAREAISGMWAVPDGIMPGSDITMYVLYAGVDAVPGAGDIVDIELAVKGVEPGTTTVDNAPDIKLIDNAGVGVQGQVERVAAPVVTSASWGAAGRNLLLRIARGITAGQKYAADLHILGLEAQVLETDIQVIG